MIGRMEGATETSGLHQIGFKVFGVPVAITAPSAEILARIETILPPGWTHHEVADGDQRFALTTPNNVHYRVEYPQGSVAGSSDLQIALEVLDARLRGYIALSAPDHIFVHAGVVGHRDSAIVLPGTSFSGKTTLVAELVRAGATYCSDEFAVLDEQGLVHPYPKPLSIRTNGPGQTDHPIESWGATAGEVALPVGLVVIAQYAPGAVWNPRRLSAGEAVLGVQSNTVPAQERPDQSLQAITKALDGVTTLEGARGEASLIVDELLRAASQG